MNLTTVIRLLYHRRKLMQRDYWDRRRLLTHQAKSLNDLRSFAYQHSAFYGRFHAGLYDAPLSELPVVTKAMLMEKYDDILTDSRITLSDLTGYIETGGIEERFRDRYRVASTSGSMGRRGIFLWNNDEWMTVLASFARANTWSGVTASLTRRMKLAIVSSTTPYHQSARAGATLRSWWVPTLRIDANQPMEDTVKELNSFQPESLVAYASMARVLADEQIAGRLKIRPRAVFSASEVLTVQVRQLIHRAWGIWPFNEYAATETASIAAECEQHQNLHLFEDLVIPEVVDENNNPVSPDEYGAKLLVTVLFSRTLPLIRYEISDRVKLSEAICPCSRPFALISDIEGRMEDVLYIPDNSGKLIRIHPIFFHKILDPLPSNGWQVIQETDRLRLLIAGDQKTVNQNDLIRILSKGLENSGAIAPPIQIEFVSAIPRTKMGKAPFIVARRAKI